MRSYLWSALLLAGLTGCPPTNDNPPDAGSDGGTNGQTDSGTSGPTIDFEVEVIEGLNTEAIIGDNAALDIAGNGAPAAAYGYVAEGSTKPMIHYAVRQPDGTWNSESVIEVGINLASANGFIQGIGLAHVGNVPHIVYLGGDDDNDPVIDDLSDLMLSTKSGSNWSERTLVDTSAEAPGNCPNTQNTCNVGGVVGSHASIEANPGGSGFAVVYRDTHFGFARDDLALSDVEVYAEGGPVSNSVVDPVRSGGAYGDIAYLNNGNLVVGYNLEEPLPNMSRTGVWAGAYDGSEWQLRHVHPNQTSAKVSLAVASDGTVYMALYDATTSDLVVATSSDNGLTWMTTGVDTRGKVGLHPDIAIDLEDRPVVSYTYCGPQSETNCPGQLGARAEVRLARLEGGEWKTYLVDNGQGFGGVGFFTRVVVTSDGKLGVAFQDARNNDLLFAKEQ